MALQESNHDMTKSWISFSTSLKDKYFQIFYVVSQMEETDFATLNGDIESKILIENNSKVFQQLEWLNENLVPWLHWAHASYLIFARIEQQQILGHRSFNVVEHWSLTKWFASPALKYKYSWESLT